MPKFAMAVPHKLSQKEAVQRMMELLEEMKTEFGHKLHDLHEEWDGSTGRFTLTAMGCTVSGKLTVKATQVDITGNLPFAAVFFKGKIESTIRRHARALLV